MIEHLTSGEKKQKRTKYFGAELENPELGKCQEPRNAYHGQTRTVSTDWVIGCISECVPGVYSEIPGSGL